VIGFIRSVPVALFGRLVALAWAGFVLNLVTGTLMLMAYAQIMAHLWTFQLKMLSIGAGGLSVWMLARCLASARLEGEETSFSPRAKWLAAASLLFWIAAIAMGRLIAYTAPEGV
jgi:hypothetical protein